MPKCYHDKERECDSECEAYSETKNHGTHCLQLASHWELARRMENFESASDIHSYFMKCLSQSIDSVRDLIPGLLK